jgi:hypothetical protein
MSEAEKKEEEEKGSKLGSIMLVLLGIVIGVLATNKGSDLTTEKVSTSVSYNAGVAADATGEAWNWGVSTYDEFNKEEDEM